MKKLMKTPALLLAVCISFAACTKQSNDVDNNTNTPTSSSVTVPTGTFIISSYTQRTEDKTSQFAGTSFTFNSDGSVTAVTKSGTTTNGTWRYSPAVVSYYGSSPSIASLAINLGNASPLSRLARTWNISSSSNTSLSLVNPEPNDDEHIQFKKQ